ncbi:MAG: sulfatase [Ginsengibacter sp.]
MKKILFILTLACSTMHGNAQKQSQKPNVVIIFMDDMGYGDPDFNMGIGYITPNIDRLGAEGMRFTNFYSAQGTCTASRAGILTGCYPNRIGLFGALSPWSETALNPKEETIANVLKNGGYSTCMVGKWHLGSKSPFLPTHFGFDQYLGLPYSNDMWPVNYDGKPITDTSNHRYNYPILPLLQGDKVVKHIRTLEDQGQLTQSYTRFATKFIKEHKAKPFFLYFANSMVHVPIAASPAFLGKSENGLFGDVMQEVDWSVGQIMKTLRDEGLDKNTLVIFTSDNGPWLNYGNHAGNTGGLREGKGTSFEGGQREPCLMRWPNHIPAGTVCNKIASTIDLLPTITKITKSKLPEKKIDGVDILPLLLGNPDANPRTEFVYYYNRNSLECIRQGKWKLVFPHQSRSYKSHPPGHDGFPGPVSQINVPLALYDMSTDPGETMDVQEQHPDVMKQLEALADKYRNDLGDDLTNVEGTGRRPAGVCIECKTNIRKP